MVAISRREFLAAVFLHGVGRLLLPEPVPPLEPRETMPNLEPVSAEGTYKGVNMFRTDVSHDIHIPGGPRLPVSG